MNKDFVVEYSPSWCHIEDISIQPCETLEQYKEGFKKHKCSCPDANFGDFFHWNNSGWAIVKARNASDALEIYFACDEEIFENKKTTPKKRKKEKKEEKEYTAGYENITKDPFCGEGW